MKLSGKSLLIRGKDINFLGNEKRRTRRGNHILERDGLRTPQQTFHIQKHSKMLGVQPLCPYGPFSLRTTFSDGGE